MNYTVTDNLGHSSTLLLDAFGNSGSATFALSFSGIGSVTVAAALLDGSYFDFSIDDVAFTSEAPEPASLLLMPIVLIGSTARAIARYEARL